MFLSAIWNGQRGISWHWKPQLLLENLIEYNIAPARPDESAVSGSSVPDLRRQTGKVPRGKINLGDFDVKQDLRFAGDFHSSSEPVAIRFAAPR
jgi:hypothetical protein